MESLRFIIGEQKGKVNKAQLEPTGVLSIHRCRNEMNEQREIILTCDICGEGYERFPVGGLLETVSMTIPIETCVHPDPTNMTRPRTVLGQML